MINARSDGVATKASFKNAFRKRRCLIVADGFYEWQKTGKTKQPYLFERPDGQPFAFAGLWEGWSKAEPPIESCTIITTDANNVCRQVHDRMPVILPKEAYAIWLEPEADPKDLTALLCPAPADALVARPVSRRVNSPANDDEGCVGPAE